MIPTIENMAEKTFRPMLTYADENHSRIVALKEDTPTEIVSMKDFQKALDLIDIQDKMPLQFWMRL